MHKKAYLRTLEAVLAIIITFLFLIYIIPANFNSQNEKTQNILNPILKNDKFREGIISLNTTCIDRYSNNSLIDILDNQINENKDYFLCKDIKNENLPKKEVVLNTALFTGNITHYGLHVIRLYYWDKN